MRRVGQLWFGPFLAQRDVWQHVRAFCFVAPLNVDSGGRGMIHTQCHSNRGDDGRGWSYIKIVG